MPHVQPSNDPSLFRTNDIRQLSRHDNTISTSRSETTTNLHNDPSLFRTNDIRQLSRHDNTISTSRSETTTKLQLDDSEYHMYNLATTRHYSAPTTSANCRGTITLSLLHGGNYDKTTVT
ncbi:hypothetical protein J6590_045309 [Homalodisca vitripennis]|nr:hypothetical protein J6590_045309 [Homalodisca vitripennis]